MSWIQTTACFLCVFTFLLTPTHTRNETVLDWRRKGRRELRKAINAQASHNKGLARNVILFIGDGMGMSTVTASRIYEGQTRGRSGEENLLYFERFPHVGITKTYNADAQIPDSAASGTAILTGVKVNSGVIGCDTRVKKRNCTSFTQETKLPSILHQFIEKGLSTGIVTNARITHATPASAYAHTPSRSWEGDADMALDGGCDRVEDIAKQLIRNNSDIKVLLGGGRRYFLNDSTPDPVTGRINYYQRRDGLDLIEEWKKDKQAKNASHRFVWDAESLETLDTHNTEYLLGLFDSSHMNYEYSSRGQGKDWMLSLAELTETAIRVLEKDRKGFFLLVEGARIDWAHHANSAGMALEETVEFDMAVKRAAQLTSQEDTLILVTADHSHTMAIQGYAPRGNDILGLSQPKPDNGALDGFPYTTLGYTNGQQFGRRDLREADTGDMGFQQTGCIPLGVETHAGEDVMSYARGPWAHLLHGTHEQSYLYHVMEYAACVGWSRQFCDNIRPGRRSPGNG